MSCPWGNRNCTGTGQLLAGGGFRWFFFFGFFFLFFFLEFVTDEFEDGDFSSVTDTIAGGDDASVASGAVGEFGRDFAEKFFGYGGRAEGGGRGARRRRGVALAEGD